MITGTRLSIHVMAYTLHDRTVVLGFCRCLQPHRLSFQNLVILGVGFATHVSVGLTFQSKEQSMQGDEDICSVGKE